MTTKSSIYIRNLQIYAHHGVMPQENTVGGHFTVSLEAWMDIQKAALSDSVKDTVSYADLLQIIQNEMNQTAALLENVAWRIAQAVFDKYDCVDAVEVSVSKNNPPMGAQCEGAGVSIRMDR